MRTIFYAAAIIASAALSLPAYAQYNSGDTIHLYVGYGTGGGTDLAARHLASGLEKKLEVNVVVENYPTGGGLEAINRLISAKPDGRTIALVPLPAAAMLYLDPERGGTFTKDDFEIVATHDYSVLTIATAADGEWDSLQELIDAAKANPGKITASSSGVLSNGHLGVLRLNHLTNANINWVTFENAGIIRSNVLGHHVDVEFSGIGEVAPAVEAGDLRLLAVLSEERLPEFPDVPTAVEQGIDLVSTSTRVVIAPKGTPKAELDTLESTIAELTNDPEYRSRAQELQVSLFYQDAETTKAFWQSIEEDFGPLVEQFRSQ